MIDRCRPLPLLLTLALVGACDSSAPKNGAPTKAAKAEGKTPSDAKAPDGKGPACCEVCPREAVIYGKYTDLLEEARQRLAEAPEGKYVPKIYGETDGGGTQVLYQSHVPFENLDFPELGEDGVPKVQQTVQHGIYQGFIAPAGLPTEDSRVSFNSF